MGFSDTAERPRAAPAGPFYQEAGPLPVLVVDAVSFQTVGNKYLSSRVKSRAEEMEDRRGRGVLVSLIYTQLVHLQPCLDPSNVLRSSGKRRVTISFDLPRTPHPRYGGVHGLSDFSLATCYISRTATYWQARLQADLQSTENCGLGSGCRQALFYSGIAWRGKRD